MPLVSTNNSAALGGSHLKAPGSAGGSLLEVGGHEGSELLDGAYWMGTYWMGDGDTVDLFAHQNVHLHHASLSPLDLHKHPAATVAKPQSLSAASARRTFPTLLPRSVSFCAQSRSEDDSGAPLLLQREVNPTKLLDRILPPYVPTLLPHPRQLLQDELLAPNS